MTLFNIGYEGRSLDDFIAALRAAGVTLLADVRDAPISRKPGFSKNALANALQEQGIAYRHIRALGCPKPVRDAWKEDHGWVGADAEVEVTENVAFFSAVDVYRKIVTKRG